MKKAHSIEQWLEQLSLFMSIVEMIQIANGICSVTHKQIRFDSLGCLVGHLHTVLDYAEGKVLRGVGS